MIRPLKLKHFEVVSARIMYDIDWDVCSHEKHAQAVVKVLVQGRESHEVADGYSPETALLKALCKALRPHFPFVAKLMADPHSKRLPSSEREIAQVIDDVISAEFAQAVA